MGRGSGSVDDGVLRVLGVELDIVTGVRTVRRGDLKPLAARRACDEKDLSLRVPVKALEEMDPAQRDPLPGVTLAAGEDDVLEEPVHRIRGHGPMARAGLVGLSGWPAR